VLLATEQVKHFFATAPAGIGTAMSAALPESVVIAIELEDVGLWSIVHENGAVHISREQPKIADCRLRCSVEDFLALICGDLDGRHLFLSGRLELEGDVGLMLTLEEVVRQSHVA